MLREIADFVELIQSIFLILGVAGMIVAVFGFLRKQKSIIIKGGYMLILAAVLYVCGYLIIEATKQKAMDYMDNTYIEIGQ